MGRCLRSGCDNHPSILRRSLHHVLVRASGRTVAKSRTGQRSFVGPSPVSEEKRLKAMVPESALVWAQEDWMSCSLGEADLDVRIWERVVWSRGSSSDLVSLAVLGSRQPGSRPGRRVEVAGRSNVVWAERQTEKGEGEGIPESKGLSWSDSRPFLASKCGASCDGGSGALGPAKFRVCQGFREHPRPQEFPSTAGLEGDLACEPSQPEGRRQGRWAGARA